MTLFSARSRRASSSSSSLATNSSEIPRTWTGAVSASRAVPASVSAPAGELAATAAAPAATAPVLRLEGSWAGSENEEGERKFVTISLTPPTGTLTYERALSMTVSLSNVAQGRDGSVRFEAQAGRGVHYYAGRWDGQKISGKIAADPAGQTVIGSFELERR